MNKINIKKKQSSVNYNRYLNFIFFDEMLDIDSIYLNVGLEDDTIMFNGRIMKS